MKRLFAMTLTGLMALTGFVACQPKVESCPECERPRSLDEHDRGATAKDAAKTFQHDLKELAGEKFYKDLGFASLEEVKEAQTADLGRPLSRIWLNCDSLLDSSAVAGIQVSNAHSLAPFVLQDQLLFSLKAGKYTRSTILVDSVPDIHGQSKLGWMALELGNSYLAGLIDSLIPSLAEKYQVPDSAFYLVEIPVLAQSYVAFTDKDGIAHISRIPTPHLNGGGYACPVLKEGEFMRVDSAVTALYGCEELKSSCRPPVPQPNPFRQSTPVRKSSATSVEKKQTKK
ncbi:MAG: hypothetical protein ABIW76_20495 [Fibrobacteria bacterium]